MEVSSGETVTNKNVTLLTYTTGSIRGVVIDQSSNRIKDVEVNLSVGGISYPVKYTNALGKFAFAKLAPVGNYRLTANKEGYAEASLSNIAVAGGAITEITMTVDIFPSASIEGIVRDANGNRLWNARVNYYNSKYEYSTSINSDWTGNYSINTFPVGNADLSTSLYGFITQVTDGIPIVAGNNEIDIILNYNTSSAAAIWGRVRDTNNTPQPGINIKVSGDTTSYATTDKQGRYFATNLNPGTHTVEVEDFPSDATPITGISLVAGEVRGNINLYIDFELAKITGQVLVEASEF